jgi:hypothetical protein
VLDRVTGQFVTGVPFVKQTWAKGLDSNGRPIMLPDTEPTPKGQLVYPVVMAARILTALLTALRRNSFTYPLVNQAPIPWKAVRE